MRLVERGLLEVVYATPLAQYARATVVMQGSCTSWVADCGSSQLQITLGRNSIFVTRESGWLGNFWPSMKNNAR